MKQQNEIAEQLSFESSVKIPAQLFSGEEALEIQTSACYLLINKSHGLNATDAKYTFDGVTKEGVDIGDWEVTIKRIKS